MTSLTPPIPAEELVPWWEWREGKRPPSWVRTIEDEDVEGAAQAERAAPLPELICLEDFLATEEPGAEPLVGDENNVVIPSGGDVMFYGDGGAGKTTLAIDLAFHLAAGDDWLGLPIPHAVTVALIENEGPRPLFREKLRRKLKGWTGSSLDGRLHVLERPWGKADFADESWRELLAAAMRFQAIDVLIAGSVTRLGMNEAGTLQEVRDFMAMIDDLRKRTGRRLLVILIHHENKGGQVSGAWEGSGDTLCHVQGQGHGRTRLFFQKARWASAQHGIALNLTWAEGEGFELAERKELDDEAIAELICDFVGAHPGTGWTKVENAIKGVGAEKIRPIRDRLLADCTILNVDAGQLRPLQERRAAHLYVADDPTIRHLRPASDAAPTQPAPLWAEGEERLVRRASRPKGTHDVGAAVLPPTSSGEIRSDG